MGWGKVNAGGAGASLGCTVKAYVSELLLPAAGKENDIAIITETPITEWQMRSDQPTTRSDGTALIGGEVWIKTDDQGVTWNALKKNGIFVCPVRCEQHVDGAWASKGIKIYKGSAWTDTWGGYLFKDGEEYVDVTGGWVGFKPGTGDYASHAQKTEGLLRLYVYQFYDYIDGFGTVNPINLDAYTTLHVYVASATPFIRIGACPVLDDTAWDLGAVTQVTVTGEATLSISSLTGSWHIWFGTYIGGSSSSRKTMDASTTKIWLT